MRIVQINAVYKTKSTGRIVMEMHEFFSAHGIDSYVAYGGENTSTIADPRLFKIGNFFDHKFHALLYRLDKLQGCHSKLATKQLIKRIKSIAPDIVLTHNLHANYLHVPYLFQELSKLKIKTVIALHDCWFFTGGCYHFTQYNCGNWKRKCTDCPVFGRVAKKKYEWNLSVFSQLRPIVLATSKWIASVAKQSPITNQCEIDMIYDWVDMDAFCPRSDVIVRKKYGMGNKRYIIGVSVDWSEEKGRAEIVEVAKKFPEYVFVLIGNQVKGFVYPENVITIPFIEDKITLAELYSGAELFFNPSKQETFGLVSAEALACGVPIAVYNVTACPEFVNGYTGFVMNGRDDICNAVETLIERNRTFGRKFISEKCREYAQENFDLSKNIGQYISLFQEKTGGQ